jgi:transcriptional regulator with XRE-family HTH domain
MTIPQRVGAYVMAHRHRRKMSQQDLAERVGRTRVSISQIETGVQCPPLETLYALAEALGVEVYDLLPTRRQARG